MSREAFPLYPLVWRPDAVPHGSSLRGRLFAMEEIDPSPGLGATGIPALVIRCEDECDCVDAFGRRTRSLKGQAVRVPVAYGLERLQPLVVMPDGTASRHLPMIELVAIHLRAEKSTLFLVGAYVHSDPMIAREAMPRPEPYMFDVVEQATAYQAALDQAVKDASDLASGKLRLEDVPIATLVAEKENIPHKIEPGLNGIPHT